MERRVGYTGRQEKIYECVRKQEGWLDQLYLVYDRIDEVKIEQEKLNQISLDVLD